MATYLRPQTLEESLASLAEKPRRVIAGGTDIYPARVSHRTWGRSGIAGLGEDWLDITAIPELASIEETDSAWRIGALVTWTQLCQSSLPSCFDGLIAASREVGGRQIQNRGTLVGNLCNASPAADGVPPLLCLDAALELSSERDSRHLDLSEFILGNRQTALKADEMVSAVIIPKPQTPGPHRNVSRFYKLGARRYLVISIVMAACNIEVDDAGCISRCRIAVGSCSAVACRLLELEADLMGVEVTANLADKVRDQHFSMLSPIDDVRADAAYRRHAARIAVIQLLEWCSESNGSIA